MKTLEQHALKTPHFPDRQCQRGTFTVVTWDEVGSQHVPEAPRAPSQTRTPRLVLSLNLCKEERERANKKVKTDPPGELAGSDCLYDINKKGLSVSAHQSSSAFSSRCFCKTFGKNCGVDLCDAEHEFFGNS